MSEKPNVFQDADAKAVLLAKTLVRSAQYGALAVLDPSDGSPLVSRVGVATDLDGTPTILISGLAAHTRALLADPRCSLLLGQVGKGDPLAHARISLSCLANRLIRNAPEERHIRRRYLNKNPKASLYAELGDFQFFRLSIVRASLNGGFGNAYKLGASELTSPVPDGLAEMEQDALDHMNTDHYEAIQLYARHFAGKKGKGWRLCGLDSEGLDLMNVDHVERINFGQFLSEVCQLRPTLVKMAFEARNASAFLPRL